MIHISEIESIIFESVAISITGVLLCELIKQKVRILFCDETHMPYGQLVSLSSNYKSAECTMKQVEWQPEIKDKVWELIVYHKIEKQKEILFENNKLKESIQLCKYLNEIQIGDFSNREGIAAKVYFDSLFGASFIRNRKIEDELNACLNYGYSVLLSIVCREIVKNGYCLSLGIHHRGVYNPYNLACDIIEPFRPIVDRIIIKNFDGNFNNTIKMKFWDLGNYEVLYDNKKAYLPNAINDYFRSICRCLDEKCLIVEPYNFL